MELSNGKYRCASATHSTSIDSHRCPSSSEIVFWIRNDNDEIVVVKIHSKAALSRKAAPSTVQPTPLDRLREALRLQKAIANLPYPACCIRLLDLYETEETSPNGKDIGRIYAVYNWLEKGSSMESVPMKIGQDIYCVFPDTKYSEADVKELALSACVGASILHMHNIIHGDIKPQNIFIAKNGAAVLGDLDSLMEGKPFDGSSKKQLLIQNALTTYAFSPPEYLNEFEDKENDERKKLIDGVALDVWCIGLCTWVRNFISNFCIQCWLFNYLPFPNVTNTLQLFEEIKHFKVIETLKTSIPKFPMNQQQGKEQSHASLISKNACDFLCQCLQPDPEKRPTPGKLLQHPWLTKSLVQ